MGALQLKSVFKTYPNGHQAVRGVSLDIEDGEFLVLVGPSGCGKSTLLRSISGLEDITEGEIHIADERVDELAPAKRDIAMVFQNYALYPHMTVYKNMAYGLKNRGYDKADIDAKVQVAAKMLQLEDYLLRKPSQLSGGQRQRVAMGRAIVRNPKLFLFDEPLSNLDASLRLAMRLEIKRLQRELNITSVFVTHDQVEAMTLADRLAVVNNGQIEQIGTPRDVYHQPRSIFVARFMGSPAMNLLTATYATGGHLQLMGGETFELPDSLKHQLADGQKVYLGLRPEHVKVAVSEGAALLRFDVGLSEELGSSQLLHGKVAGEEFSLNLPQFDQHDEAQLGLTVEADKIHLFDFESGLRIGGHP